MSVEGGEGVDEGNDETGSTKVMYEHGVTVVDAVTGVATLGQFVDNVLMSRTRTLLASFGPSKVSAANDSSKNESACIPLAHPARVLGQPITTRRSSQLPGFWSLL